MSSKFALFCNILLASAALAFPSSQLEAWFAPRFEDRSYPVNSVGLSARGNADSTVAGAAFVWPSDDTGILTTVIGSFATPVFWGSTSAFYISVAIDALTCPDFAFQAGITGTIQNAQVSYSVWYAPGDSQTSTPPPSIIPGDNITITLTIVNNLQGGIAATMTIMNRNSQQASWAFAIPSTAPCLKDASWTIGMLSGVALANFSSVVITGASASGTNGHTYDLLSGVDIFDIIQNGENLTSVDITSSDSLIITNLLGSGSQ